MSIKICNRFVLCRGHVFQRPYSAWTMSLIHVFHPAKRTSLFVIVFTARWGKTRVPYFFFHSQNGSSPFAQITVFSGVSFAPNFVFQMYQLRQSLELICANFPVQISIIKMNDYKYIFILIFG